MIFDKARMAKLSGLMTESKHKGIKDAMADQFGGGKEEGDAWLDGDVTTEGAEEEEGAMMHEKDEELDEAGSEEELDEAGLRRMIRSALSEAKKEMDKEKKEKEKKKAEKAKTEARKKKEDEKAKTEARKKKKDDDEELDETTVRESIRKELHSILRSKGVTLGGTGWGFKK
jgi:hypothetical protein